MSYKERLRAAALERVKEYAEKLAEADVRPRSVILFGSYAKGDYTEESDVDVCVIAENLPEDELARRSLSSLYPHVGVRAIGYFPGEFLEMLERLNVIVLEIVEYGIPVIDDGTFARAKEVLERLKGTGVVRPEQGGWRFSTAR
ncbi:MAG: nucleotidyltransferase domain-containing protein [Nitrososphaerota archaeon]|nr:nucleotidyltransferase domain-containing protein [Candidatus Calditenuis fumarioli]